MAPSELIAALELDTIDPAIRPKIPKQQKLDPIAESAEVTASIIVTNRPIPIAQTPRSIPSYLVQSSRTWQS